MAEHQLPKLTVRVRFPSSAPENYPWSEAFLLERASSTAINCGHDRALHGSHAFQFDRPSSLTAARNTVGSAAAAGTMTCRAHAGRVACTRACVIAA